MFIYILLLTTSVEAIRSCKYIFLEKKMYWLGILFRLCLLSSIVIYSRFCFLVSKFQTSKQLD